MKILFPTPVTWDGNFERYFQRDGGRMTQWFNEQPNHSAVKVIYASSDSSLPPPSHPMLAVGTPQEWQSPDFWKQFHADAALVYFGISPKLQPVVNALKSAGIRVVLKMDAALGFLPRFSYLWHHTRTNYYHHLENPSGAAAVAAHAVQSDYLLRKDRGVLKTALLSFVRAVCQLGIQGVNYRKQLAYLLSFDAITVETPLALQNTQNQLQKARPALPTPPVHLLHHPVLDSFTFDSHNQKEKILLATAGSWFVPLKGGKILACALPKIFKQHPDYQAIIVGHGSPDIKKRAEQEAGRTLPIQALPFCPREDLEPRYRKAQIFILPSGAEGSPNAFFEALASGCSCVISPFLPQLRFIESFAAGRPFKHYTPTACARAIHLEIQAWENGQRAPTQIAHAHTPDTHLTAVCNQLLHILH